MRFKNQRPVRHEILGSRGNRGGDSLIVARQEGILTSRGAQLSGFPAIVGSVSRSSEIGDPILCGVVANLTVSPSQEFRRDQKPTTGTDSGTSSRPQIRLASRYACRPQHRLNFFPLPQGQTSLRPTRCPLDRGSFASESAMVAAAGERARWATVGGRVTQPARQRQGFAARSF